MRTKLAAVAVVVLSTCFGFAIPAARAQAPCSLRTMAGTFVSVDRGASLTVDLTQPGVLGPAPGAKPSPPAWLVPGFAPFVNIARVTYTPDGIGDGYFWMFAGSVGPAPEPIPLHIEITELNEDCTGKFHYALPNGATIEERIIVFDNGRQYRSVPLSISSPGIQNLSWIGSGQRVSPDHQSGAPHPANPQGSYLLACDNVQRSAIYTERAVAAAFLLRMDVSRTGDFTGLLYERYGALSTDGREAWGSLTVSPDGSFTSSISFQGITLSSELRGVFFDEGKEFYALAIPRSGGSTQYSFCQGTRIRR
jgi:hypothetical protein